MRDKLYDELSKLPKKDLALLAVGELDLNHIKLSDELTDYVSQNPDILSIIATEILARQRGFKVEETDIIKLKRDGEWVGDYPVFKYGDDLYLLIEETIYKLVKVDKLEPLKQVQKVQQKQETITRQAPRPRANIE
ncbi:MAG: hypothetical protein RQ990_01470 [Candidatus Hydrothermia bacterium]|jgi:hypothetical protein|nr:hypothetical protein [Candidatus Hydrothermia bacterium]